MELTQDQYNLWTGQTASFSSTDWCSIVSVASKRLAQFLCLEELPADADEDLTMLLANFICAVLKFRGNNDAHVEEKRIRNFTIRFSSSSAANAFAQITEQYPDIIAEYSQCDCGLTVEESAPECPWHERF